MNEATIPAAREVNARTHRQPEHCASCGLATVSGVLSSIVSQFGLLFFRKRWFDVVVSSRRPLSDFQPLPRNPAYELEDWA